MKALCIVATLVSSSIAMEQHIEPIKNTFSCYQQYDRHVRVLIKQQYLHALGFEYHSPLSCFVRIQSDARVPHQVSLKEQLGEKKCEEIERRLPTGTLRGVAWDQKNSLFVVMHHEKCRKRTKILQYFIDNLCVNDITPSVSCIEGDAKQELRYYLNYNTAPEHVQWFEKISDIDCTPGMPELLLLRIVRVVVIKNWAFEENRDYTLESSTQHYVLYNWRTGFTQQVATSCIDSNLDCEIVGSEERVALEDHTKPEPYFPGTLVTLATTMPDDAVLGLLLAHRARSWLSKRFFPDWQEGEAILAILHDKSYFPSPYKILWLTTGSDRNNPFKQVWHRLNSYKALRERFGVLAGPIAFIQALLYTSSNT